MNHHPILLDPAKKPFQYTLSGCHYEMVKDNDGEKKILVRALRKQSNDIVELKEYYDWHIGKFPQDLKEEWMIHDANKDEWQPIADYFEPHEMSGVKIP